MAADGGSVGDSAAVRFPIVRAINVGSILRKLNVELP
jgi:hypothetical protein